MTTILVVDDRAINREFLVTLLSYANYKIIEASDGAHAYEITKAQFPDLVITDIAMPVMSGYDLAKKLQEDPETKHIPIIFYTATYRLEDAALIAMKCGVKYVLSKPSDPELILETVKKAFAAKTKSNVTPVTSNAPTDETSIIPEQKAPLAEEEDKLTHSTAGLNPAQLTVLTSRLYTLMELSLDLLAERDPQKLLSLFCKGAKKIMGAKYCVLGILQEDGSSLKYYFVSGMENTPKNKMIFPNLHHGIISQILKSRSPLRINNVREQSNLELPPNHPTETCLLGFPIITADQLYGFLYFADKSDGTTFNGVDVEIIITLASQVAVLYENIRLHEEHIS